MVLTGPLVDTILNKNPAPGSYEAENVRSKIAYSLSGKVLHEDKKALGVPGPGHYPVPFTINKEGRYFSRKHKNSCVRDFGKMMGRSTTALSRVPGPSAYDVSGHQDISPDGRYCLSKSTNCLTRKFGSSPQRADVILNKLTPGPGNYRLPSDFGHYLARGATK
jgi:Sperm-tail PG-rich repeat